MWGGETQEVGVSKEERKKERKSSATTRSVGEGKGAQWSEGVAPKGSSNVYGGVDNTQRDSNLCRV